MMFSSERPVFRFLIAQSVSTILIATASAFFWGRVGLIGAILGGAVASMNAI
jgi:hypothetical protein